MKKSRILYKMLKVLM